MDKQKCSNVHDVLTYYDILINIILSPILTSNTVTRECFPLPKTDLRFCFYG